MDLTPLKLAKLRAIEQGATDHRVVNDGFAVVPRIWAELYGTGCGEPIDSGESV